MPSQINSLVNALSEKNAKQVSYWLDQSRVVLVDYLRCKYRAPYEDAQDCAQDALLILMDKFEEGIFTDKHPGAYILATARHLYFKIYRDNKQKSGEEIIDFVAEPSPNPEEILADSEMVAALKECVKKLNDKSRELIAFFLKDTKVKAEEIAEKLDTSPGNIWTRKHRINKQLQVCIEKKMEIHGP
ncbi:MAG: sigma-70 family RNA polymerase sigma factor [Balneolales bacterium]|nr:sigma-70 family RNA polymerase sigma factor [Balneolales bacterium]